MNGITIYHLARYACQYHGGIWRRRAAECAYRDYTRKRTPEYGDAAAGCDIAGWLMFLVNAARLAHFGVVSVGVILINASVS